jgi:ribose transport system substrate-binding protein
MKLRNMQTKAYAVGSAAALVISMVALTPPANAAGYVIGVSNAWAGNSWREEMVCAIKAESTLSGKVASVVVASRTTDSAGQLADVRSLISQGVNAIIVNAGDVNALTPAVDEAVEAGIKVVAVDNAITDKKATIVSNDQVAYGAVGAEALAKAMNYKGNVLYMRGAAGAGADTDRNTGFQKVMKKYPKIKIAKTVFTNWDWATGGTMAKQLLQPGKFQGVWTSGIDYPVVQAMTTKLHGKYIPLVGADNNEFVHQTITLASKGFVGIIVGNPAVVGGAAAKVAIQLLDGKTVASPLLLHPVAWTMATNAKDIAAHYYPDQAATFSSSTSIKGLTSFTASQLFRCRAPQDDPETTG